MERGNTKHGPTLEGEMKKETESTDRAQKTAHTQEGREKDDGSGHRIAGSGSSADTYNWRDHGEVGGRSHPKPDERTDSDDENEEE